MRLRASCGSCRRDLLIQQAIEAGGHCPWCGVAFQKDYAATLVDALSLADAGGDQLLAALERIAAMRPGFTLEVDPLLEQIRDALAGVPAEAP